MKITHRLCRAGITLFFALCSYSSYADFSLAMAGYKEKKYPQAMAELKRLASLGHKDSQFNLGVMYYRGEGVEKNPIEAYAWMGLAAEAGDLQFSHMRDIVQRKLREDEKDLALQRTEDLLRQFGEAAAPENLSPIAVDEKNCIWKSKTLQQPFFQYPALAFSQNMFGRVDVAFDSDANGFARNFSIIAATHPIFIEPVLKELGNLRHEPYFTEGKAVPVAGGILRIQFNSMGTDARNNNIKIYLDSLKEKANSGHKDPYVDGVDLLPEVKFGKAQRDQWMYAAAQLGLPAAQYLIGKDLRHGEDCEPDRIKALQWITASARPNAPDTQYFLAVSLLTDSTSEQNKTLALEWLNHAAAAKHTKAMMKLAWVHATDKHPAVFNPKKSLEYVSAIYDNYEDKLTANETLAAAQAANLNFGAAVETQKKTIEIARGLRNMPIDNFETKLAAYESHQVWRE